MDEVTLPPLAPLMEVVTDYGVDSLRVGVYEARARFIGEDRWKLTMLREKREAAFNRVAERIAAYAQQAASAAVLQERERLADELHRDIMNLPHGVATDVTLSPWVTGYLTGHKTARHDAAELAAAIREGA